VTETLPVKSFLFHIGQEDFIAIYDSVFVYSLQV